MTAITEAALIIIRIKVEKNKTKIFFERFFLKDFFTYPVALFRIK